MLPKKSFTELLAEFNEVRRNQKTVNQFTNTSDLFAHAKETAILKANILSQIESLSKNN